jgi:hypothetical protein
MGMLAAPLAIGGALIQGLSSIAGGNAQAAGLKAQGQEQQQQDAIDAQDTKIGAEQAQSNRLVQLQKTIGSIRATVSGRGLDPNSPSGAALEDNADTTTQRAIGIDRFNAWQTASNYTLAGSTAVAQANLKASMARQAGYVTAASSLFKAATDANSAKWFG